MLDGGYPPADATVTAAAALILISLCKCTEPGKNVVAEVGDRPASFGPDLMSVRQRSESLRFCHSSSSVPRSSRVLAAGSPERCAA